jgi:hypothetical protein
MSDPTGKAQGLAIDNLSFSALQNLPNTPPVLSAIPDQTVYANTLLTFTATATDTDQPPQSLTFALGSGAPAGASITPSGIFNWTPSPAQSPSTNLITVTVTDNGAPPLSDSKSFDVIVYLPNTPPRLAPIPNQTVFANNLLTFPVSATDTDQPPESLTFALAPGAPAGASVTTNGVFSWTPTSLQAPSSNTITMTVTDSGAPPLSDSRNFTVVVQHLPVLQGAPAAMGPFSDESSTTADTVQHTITAALTSTTRFYRIRADVALRIIQVRITGNQVVLQYQ